ncbi:endo-1,4-beta-xylanase [Leadbetterella sp. DM7]|uniref:endo-1,4-beta-xylanase n=1 Tax=Leadbetterella sp. DM7 TaxID=3235085 RepID=UPI00349EA8AF
MKITRFYLSIIALPAILNCTAQKKVAPLLPVLKDVFWNDFSVGTALSALQIEGRDHKADSLVKKQFNVLTPENSMKSMFLQPEWGKFDFRIGDRLTDYAAKNNMQVVGHTLIWHSQLPAYAQTIRSKDSLQAFFNNHIRTVAAHYDKKVLGWDVVNEALNEDGTMRPSIFQRLLGDDFVTEAFRLAQEASPNSELYYNDYNNEQPAKRAGAIRLIKKIQGAGVRIDGVGIQGHWHIGKVPFDDIEKSILEYSALGIKVMFTELDIEVLPRNFTGAEVNQRMRNTNDTALNPYTAGLPDSVQKQLADDYAQLFRLFLKHRDKISRITFWGVNDGQSWLNGWPVPGRTNYPLLFDRNYQPKPAYYAVIATKQQ